MQTTDEDRPSITFTGVLVAVDLRTSTITAVSLLEGALTVCVPAAMARRLASQIGEVVELNGSLTHGAGDVPILDPHA